MTIAATKAMLTSYDIVATSTLNGRKSITVHVSPRTACLDRLATQVELAYSYFGAELDQHAMDMLKYFVERDSAEFSWDYIFSYFCDLGQLLVDQAGDHLAGLHYNRSRSSEILSYTINS